MRWSAAIAWAALLAAGCNNTAPSSDPFAPRLLPSTRVPPPATGAAVDGSYYTSPTPGPLPTPAPAALPSGSPGNLDAAPNGPFRTSPSGAGSFTPNQSGNLRSSSHRTSTRTRGRVDRSVVPASYVTETSAAPAAEDDEDAADNEDEDEAAAAEEDNHSRGRQATSVRFSKRSESSGAVDIMDLPPVGRSR